MTGTINKTIILGHLGGNPDIRMTEGHREVARFTVATNERFTKDGEKHQHTEWHRLVIFNEGLITNVIKPYLKKGSQVHVEGSNRTSSYTDKNGVERFGIDIIVREITLLDRKPAEERR